MVSPFEAVPDEEPIFRLANRGGAFLPEGALLPLPLWFRPTSADEEEAAHRGRRPGLSVWRSLLTTVAQARHLANKPEGEAFQLLAGECRQIGVAVGVAVDVVSDPLFNQKPTPGWEGHALIEGLARPQNGNRKVYKNLRAKLAECCRPLEN